MTKFGEDSSAAIWRCRHKVKNYLLWSSRRYERLRYRRVFKQILEPAQASLLITRLHQSGSPFLVGRIGSVESRIIGEYLFRNCKYSRITYAEAHRNAGIFPVKPFALSSAAARLLDALSSVDLLAQWQSPYQSLLIQQKLLALPRTTLSGIEPWFLTDPWTDCLAEKKILVVHPFTSTISTQYLKRSLLFACPTILPDFSLVTFRPPQTLGFATEGYLSWESALDRMINCVGHIDFDIALIGCGAYGLPLGAAIKAMGKSAIHLGGALQLLFGIRGRRWEAMPEYAALMNDSWVRPSDDETPRAASMVDGGCYW